MKVTELTMKSFRGIDDLTLDFDSKVNVLIGVNGIGKSSILECVSVLLSWLVAKIQNQKSGHSFKDEDIAWKHNEILNKITILDDDSQKITWSLSHTRKGRRKSTSSEFIQLKDLVFSIQDRLQENPSISLPVFAYYPTNRAVIDIPLRIRKKHDFEQINAYDQALTGGQIAFREFFEWFRQREDLENELRAGGESDYQDRQLCAVRTAYESLLDNFSNLRVRRTPPLRMTVEKQGLTLSVNQLSDGEKCLLAMVGDLARRFAIANPNLDNSLNGEGVVLIDEIELHLHPEWQRDIIPKLTRTFPNCQFIMTTHSPQVVSDVHPNQIYVLESTENGVIAYHPDSSYGRDSNRILEDLMGVPERPERIKASLHRLFELIDDGQVNEARQLRQQLEQEIGVDEPEFSKADVLMWGQEVLGS